MNVNTTQGTWAQPYYQLLFQASNFSSPTTTAMFVGLHRRCELKEIRRQKESGGEIKERKKKKQNNKTIEACKDRWDSQMDCS